MILTFLFLLFHVAIPIERQRLITVTKKHAKHRLPIVLLHTSVLILLIYATELFYDLVNLTARSCEDQCLSIIALSSTLFKRAIKV